MPTEAKMSPEEAGRMYGYCKLCRKFVQLPDYIVRGTAAKFVEIMGSDEHGHVVDWTDAWELGLSEAGANSRNAASGLTG